VEKRLSAVVRSPGLDEGGAVEFLILGPLEVRDGQNVVRLGAPKQRALLGALLLHPNETVSTARLIDELWGERPPATAEKLVQGYVHALRKQLGDGVLETRAPGYRVVLEASSLDLSEFERLTQEARTAPLPRSIELRRRALALWRGQPLADVVLGGPAHNALAGLDELRLTTQIELIDAELELGRDAQLVGELEALTAAHPYQERLAAQLMLALYRSGRQAEALDVYRTMRGRLDDELGLQPGQELRELEAAILRQDETLAAPSGVASPPAPEPQPRADATHRERTAARIPAISDRRALLRAAAVVAVTAVAAAVAVVLLRDGPASITVPPNSVGVIDIGTNRVVETVPVGIRPGPVAYGEGAVWVGNLDDPSLSRINPATRKVVKNIPLPATPDAVAVGAGGVWVVNGRLGTLYRIDPSFNRVTPPAVRLGDRAITFARAGVDVGPGGSIWAAYGDSTLARADSSPPRATSLGSTGVGPAAVVFAFGSVWVANAGDNSVQRFSPVTFEEGPIEKFNVGRLPTGLGAGDGAIWVASTDDDYVTRIPVAGLGFEPARPIPVGDGPTGLAVGGGAVWVSNARAGTVSRIDTEANVVDETIPVGNVPVGLAVAGDTVWVSVQAP
jgi:YVTN family beta-propeller protein